MARTWKLTVEYDGSKFSGWQEQPNARTVMGVLRKAAEEVLKAKVELGGSGRTDAGVHATGQVAHLRTRGSAAPHPEMMRRQLNEELPADVAILKIEEAPMSFHARHDAKARTYRYQISTRKTAFNKKQVWWVKPELDLAIMSKAAQMLAGRHDFNCFRAPDPTKPENSTIVVVEEATVTTEGDLIVFRISASHFLWRMVRRIVGVLVKLGLHEISIKDFEKLLAAKCDPKLPVAEWTAPSSGLFLEEVRFSSLPRASKP